MKNYKDFFTFNCRVYYEDTDAGGLVYYANYLKFFERARTEFLRAKNIIQSDLIKDYQLLFVVKDCFVEYIKPAKLDDLITIKVLIAEIKPASIKIKQEIVKNEQILSKAEINIVCVDFNSFKPKKIPINIYNLLSLSNNQII